MSEAEVCPLCDANLQGEPIPPESRHFYGDKSHFSLMIGVEIQGVYDGVLFWMCPDCGGAWQRFPEDTLLANRAIDYIEEHNARASV